MKKFLFKRTCILLGVSHKRKDFSRHFPFFFFFPFFFELKVPWISIYANIAGKFHRCVTKSIVYKMKELTRFDIEVKREREGGKPPRKEKENAGKVFFFILFSILFLTCVDFPEQLIVMRGALSTPACIVNGACSFARRNKRHEGEYRFQKPDRETLSSAGAGSTVLETSSSWKTPFCTKASIWPHTFDRPSRFFPFFSRFFFIFFGIFFHPSFFILFKPLSRSLSLPKRTLHCLRHEKREREREEIPIKYPLAY